MPTPPEQRVLDTIIQLREKYHACTATAVAATLHLNKTYVLRLCENLRRQGLVDWTTMTGSLHPTGPSAVATSRPVVPLEEPAAEPADERGPTDDDADEKAQRRNEALARGRATAAANRLARQAAREPVNA
jgi:hypothetical protein